MNQVHLFIREFVSNEQFRRLALSNPSAALAGYKLTAAEQHSLTNLCLKLSSQGALTVKAQPTGWWA